MYIDGLLDEYIQLDSFGNILQVSQFFNHFYPSNSGRSRAPLGREENSKNVWNCCTFFFFSSCTQKLQNSQNWLFFCSYVRKFKLKSYNFLRGRERGIFFPVLGFTTVFKTRLSGMFLIWHSSCWLNILPNIIIFNNLNNFWETVTLEMWQ